MLMLLSACATTGQDSFCLVAKPIYVSRSDQLDISTQREILKHNEKGAELCGW
jgi:hypothetical protein